MGYRMTFAALFAVAGTPLIAQPTSSPVADQIVLPENTLVSVTPIQEITSKDMNEGDVHTMMVSNDVTQDGAVIIPRGAPVKATVTWHTGKGIVGKSAKFELTFNSVKTARRSWALRGKYRQEGRGNTTGALLGAPIITGRSAVLMPGTLINVFTAEEILVEPPRSAVSSAGPVVQAGGNSAPARRSRASVRCVTCRD